MVDTNIHSIYPISWILNSSAFIDFMTRAYDDMMDEFLVADFASGEHDRVPSFFIKILPEYLETKEPQKENIFVYSIDFHSLRLGSLLGNLEEANILHRARIVEANLETMDEAASLRPEIVEYLEKNLDDITWLDDFLIGANRFPHRTFQIGVLNNDVIGYLHEYYRGHTEPIIALQMIHRLIQNGGLLIVTQPCLQYKVDNIALLEQIGFEYIQGIDVVTSDKSITYLDKETELRYLSRFGHYTFFIFSKKERSGT